MDHEDRQVPEPDESQAEPDRVESQPEEEQGLADEIDEQPDPEPSSNRERCRGTGCGREREPGWFRGAVRWGSNGAPGPDLLED